MAERLPTWMELVEKFRMLADPLIGEKRAARAVDLIAGFKPSATLKPLLSLLIAESRQSTRKSEGKSPARKSRRPQR